LADRPATLKARVNATAVVRIVAVALSTGSDGSKATSPQFTPAMTMTMLKPLGIGEYAPGSSSWAAATAGESRKRIPFSCAAASASAIWLA
jgi:hypothetical protein